MAGTYRMTETEKLLMTSFSRGIASFTGNDVATQLLIPHGLAGIPIPIVTRRIDNDANLFQSWSDNTNIIVQFASIPMSGNVIQLNWLAILP